MSSADEEEILKYAREYVSLLHMGDTPPMRDDILRAFLTGWRMGEIVNAKLDDRLVLHEPKKPDA